MGRPRDGSPIEWIDGGEDPSPSAALSFGVRRGRSRLALVVVAMVALAAAVTWYATRPVRRPALIVTSAGKVVDNAGAVISHADVVFAGYAHLHHGALSSRSRCYFDLVGGTSRTDVGSDLFCGPVLFHGGVTSAPYLRYRVGTDAHTPGDHVTLSAASIPESVAPMALPGGVHLERPDHRSAPKGAGGLVPPPPAAARTDLIALVASTDVPKLPPMPATSVIGSLNIEVHLEASGRIASYGSGMDAVAAPAGQTLHAFLLLMLGGEAIEPSGSALLLGLSVDGAAPRQISQYVDAGSDGGTAGSTAVLVAAVPSTAKTLDLVVNDAGVVQRMSLLTGATAPGNIEVLQRPYTSRLGSASAPVNVVASIAGNGTSSETSLTVELDNASLDFFAPYGGGRASGPTRALFSATICLQSPDVRGQDNVVGACRPYEAASFSLTPTGGQPLRAHVYPGGFVAVDVPASFTTGTLTISGSYGLGDGRTLDFVEPCTLHVAVPA